MYIPGSPRITSLYVTFSQRIADYQQWLVQNSVIDNMTLSINHADIQRFSVMLYCTENYLKYRLTNK